MEVQEDEDPGVRALRAHLIRRGAYINDAIVCATMDDGSYRGVKALRDLDKDTVLISIPEASLMSMRSALRDVDIQRALRRDRLGHQARDKKQYSDLQLMAVHLLYEVSKGESSSHHTYLKTLPRSFDNFLYLRDGEMERALRASHAIREAVDAKSTLRESFRGVQPLLKHLSMQKNYTTLNAYRWAVSCLQSRTMFMPGDTVGCLTPYGDLHNHTPKLRPLTLWNSGEGGDTEDDGNAYEVEESPVAGEGYFDEERQQYVLVTRQRVPAGQQVFLTYGRLTNLQLLGLYGFVLDDNPFDTCVLPIWHFSENIRRHMTQEVCYLHADGCPSFELMRGLRLGVLKDGERKRWAGVILDDRAVEEGDCERRAVQALRDVVEVLILALEVEVEPGREMENRSSEAVARHWRRTQVGILNKYIRHARCMECHRD